MTTRLAILQHVLEILQFPKDVKDAIIDEASIKSVGLFANIDANRFLAMEGVKHGDVKSLELFKEWFQGFYTVNSGPLTIGRLSLLKKCGRILWWIKR